MSDGIILLADVGIKLLVRLAIDRVVVVELLHVLEDRVDRLDHAPVRGRATAGDG